MTAQETKTKANPNYAETAYQLNNSPTVKEALDAYHTCHALTEEALRELEKLPVYQQYQDAIGVEDAAKNLVRDAIDQYGSYQDVEAGEYAVRQVRHKKDYHAEPFMENFPKYAPAVIEQTVNEHALMGLVKGKLIEEDELVSNGVITTSETYAYIVK